MNLQLRLLADWPALAPLVADWQFREWGHMDPSDSPRAREARLGTHLERDRPPLTLVAMADGRPAGSVDLVPEELPDHADLGPWLSNLYVEAEFRGRGIGTALTRAVERKAADLGYRELYLCTWTARRFYERLGWRVLRSFEKRGTRVDIMSGGGRWASGP